MKPEERATQLKEVSTTKWESFGRMVFCDMDGKEWGGDTFEEIKTSAWAAGLPKFLEPDELEEGE